MRIFSFLPLSFRKSIEVSWLSGHLFCRKAFGLQFLGHSALSDQSFHCFSKEFTQRYQMIWMRYLEMKQMKLKSIWKGNSRRDWKTRKLGFGLIFRSIFLEVVWKLLQKRSLKIKDLKMLSSFTRVGLSASKWGSKAVSDLIQMLTRIFTDTDPISH